MTSGPALTTHLPAIPTGILPNPLSAIAAKIKATVVSTAVNDYELSQTSEKIRIIDSKFKISVIDQNILITHLIKQPTHEVYYVYLLRCQFIQLLNKNISPFTPGVQLDLIKAVNSKVNSILIPKLSPDDEINRAIINGSLREIARKMIDNGNIVLNGRIIAYKP